MNAATEAPRANGSEDIRPEDAHRHAGQAVESACVTLQPSSCGQAEDGQFAGVVGVDEVGILVTTRKLSLLD